MPDEITYDRVEEAEEKILNNLNDVKTTVDTLPEKVEQKLDPVQTDMSKLVENVQKQVEELRTIVENSPAGILPPSLSSFSCNSKEDGINVTYVPYVTVAHNGAITTDDSSDILSMTKGIMFRYSDEKYPTNIDEGVFAFNDEDIFDISSNGSRNPRQKSNTITGLTNGKTYYISAFPYSYGNRYYIGYTKCRTSCQWTGSKGTLTVNVTQDYDYKPLGEYTATMTPTAGGQAITKTQSGAATIVFSGLEAGEYTLSFSEVASFTKPQNQSVTVVSGHSQVLDLQYQLNVSLSSLSWAEIDEYARMGVAEELFSVGDTKDAVVNGETLTFEIVGFNHDPLADNSGHANITFGMKNCMTETRKIGLGKFFNDYTKSSMFEYLSTLFQSFPEELKNCVKTVKKKTIPNGDSDTTTYNTSMDLFLFSGVEVFGPNHLSLNGKKYASPLEGTQYSRFVNSDSRVKKLSNGTGRVTPWVLRSPKVNALNAYAYVTATGSLDSGNDPSGVCFGFCI